jgi:hypothetical protein
MYFVSSRWRNNTHVSPMRLFSSLDDAKAYQMFSRQRADGRDLNIPWEQETELILGWHYCPTLENCQRGLELLPTITPQSQAAVYPDLRKIPFDLAKI